VRYTLKTPYRDGTTHVIFEPEDFMARLAALVPKPRAHLTRYHGVFAPASPERGPRPAISRPIATRLDRFRCQHRAACTSYPPCRYKLLNGTRPIADSR
jgi:Putative transposase